MLSKALREKIPTLRLKHVFKSTLTYLVQGYKNEGTTPYQGMAKAKSLEDDRIQLYRLFEIINEVKDIHEVEDWGISLGSLEDVFLNVVRRYKGVNIIKDPQYI